MSNSHYVASCFISDLHLSTQHPKTTDFFLNWLKNAPAATQNSFESLYILGDLFEFWIGDDGLDLLGARPILEALQQLSKQCINVYFCRGNRDFLVSESLLKSYNLTLIDDNTLITPHTLVLHGDSLCLDDDDYALWYAQCRNPQWQQQFLSLSLDERFVMAQTHRQHSEQQDFYLRDIDPTALEALLKKQPSPINLVVHGHTHWPNVHQTDQYKRIVLPDWDLDDAKYPRYGWTIVSEGASYLQINDQRIEF